MNILEQLDAELEELRVDILCHKSDIRCRRKEIKRAGKAWCNARAQKEVLCIKIQRNEIDPKKCRHSVETDIDSGLGYNGFHCTKCQSLVIRERIDSKTTCIIKPSWPFKFGCKHPKDKVLDHVSIKKIVPHTEPLSVYGRYCTVCGKVWEQKEE